MEDPHRAPTPPRCRAPPRPTPPPRPPVWADLTDEQKAHLLRLLNRMLTDRLAAEPANVGGDHEPH
jgi:hypothetical protein